MIIKEEPDISRYLKMKQGEMEMGDCRLSYRLTEPVYFALTGQNERLEKLIREGMPVQGVSPQICRELSCPMYMHLQIPEKKEKNRLCVTVGKNELLFDLLEREYLPENGGPVYYTTMEAAIMGRRPDTIRLLLERGMKLDLRQDRLREIVCECDDREILKMISERKESHWEKMLDLGLVSSYDWGWNEVLREMLFDPQGIFSPPEFPEGFELPCE